MNKYTVVYSEWFQTGSHSNSIVRSTHITAESKEHIEAELEKQEIEITQVHFIFPGHLESV